MSRRIMLCLLISSFLCVSATETDYSAISGKTGGLCVIVDSDNGASALSIAKGKRFLVHALTPTEKEAPILQSKAVEQGLAEYIMAETWAGVELPYEKNHVNLLIIGDYPKASDGGLTIAEILRVLAPQGSACLSGIPESEYAKIKKEITDAGVAGLYEGNKNNKWIVLKKQCPKAWEVGLIYLETQVQLAQLAIPI